MNRARRRALAASNTPAKQVQRARQAEQVRGLSAQLADLELRNACKVSGTGVPVDAPQGVRVAPVALDGHVSTSEGQYQPISQAWASAKRETEKAHSAPKCGICLDHGRHEWFDGALRRDCPGVPATPEHEITW